MPHTSNCFELFGFDILIDEVMQCWLIEVNLSPSLGCDSPLDQKIKGNLMADLFSLIGIVPLDQRKAAAQPRPAAKYTKSEKHYSQAEAMDIYGLK